MAPKSGSEKSFSHGEEEAIPILQAILLADSFAQKFRPITLDRPKVLLPLVNVPMIDYALEWLAMANVAEVFVFCSSHSSQIINHIDKFWKNQENFSVSCIVMHDCMSAGEALRSIDQKGVIRSDFVLISGDTICNIDLEKALYEHRERRKKDKLAIMTMMTKRLKSNFLTHQTRFGQDEILFVTNEENNQLFSYEYTKDISNKEKEGIFSLDKFILQSNSSIKCRTDLQDCHIDICSPEVLYLFTDNFDYQNLRKDFLKGVLGDEIMGNKVYIHETKKGYVSNIYDIHSFSIITHDILHHHAFPFLPGKFPTNPKNKIMFKETLSSKSLKLFTMIEEGKSIFKDSNLFLPRNSQIEENCVIAENTTIGKNSSFKNCVIGRNCIIGNNVIIEKSHVWDDVCIHDNVKIYNSIICDHVIVHENATINTGCVLSFKAEIGKDFSVPSFSRLSLHVQKKNEEEESDEERENVLSNDESDADDASTDKNKNDEDENDYSQEWNVDEVGEGGKGFQWVLRKEETEEMMAMHPFSNFNLYDLAIKNLKEFEKERAKSGGKETEEKKASAMKGKGEEGEEEGDEDEDEDEEERDEFGVEVEEMFFRAVSEGVSIDNVVLEINSFKLACNKTFADCAENVFKAILKHILNFNYENSKELLFISKKTIIKWKQLLVRFLKDKDDEIYLIQTLEEECGEGKKVFAPLFSSILQILYEEDVVSEEAVCSWAEEMAGADESEKKFLNQSQPFIQWLKEAEEESEDEKDGEEEEDEEEDEE